MLKKTQEIERGDEKEDGPVRRGAQGMSQDQSVHTEEQKEGLEQAGLISEAQHPALGSQCGALVDISETA